VKFQNIVFDACAASYSIGVFGVGSDGLNLAQMPKYWGWRDQSDDAKADQ
jgi:hypothetical protein